MAPYVLPGFLRRVHSELPELQPRIVEEPTERLVEALRSGTIDAAIMALPSDVSAFEDIPLYHEEFYIVVPEGHPYAGREDVPLSALRQMDLLLLDDGHCLRDQVLDLCRSVDARPGETAGFATRAASLSTVVQCVAGGLGQSLVPESAIRVEAHRPHLATARFEGPERPGRTIGLVHRATSVRGGEFTRIAELVRQAYHEAVD